MDRREWCSRLVGTDGHVRSVPERAEPVVAFAAPVSGADGAVVLTASLEAGSHQFESPYATGDTKVVTESGTILFDNRKASILDEYAAAGTRRYQC